MSSSSKFIASVCIGAVVALGIALVIIFAPESRPTAAVASSGSTVQTAEQPGEEIQLEQSGIVDVPRQNESETVDQEPEVAADLPTLEIPAKREFDHPYSVEEEYDRFDDDTTIWLKNLAVYERIWARTEG